MFFSKLAILELCGWIEESMDDIIMRCADRNIKETKNIDHVKSQIVAPTYGFEYHRHFRRMLIQLIGLVNVERIERTVDPIKRDRLKSTLSSLKKVRDPEAHTHIKGVTPVINAPSVTIVQFQPVYDGLIEFDRVIRSARL
jgi:hypothetical protein